MICAQKLEQTAILELDSSKFTDEFPTFSGKHQRFTTPKTREKCVDFPEQTNQMQHVKSSEIMSAHRLLCVRDQPEVSWNW